MEPQEFIDKWLGWAKNKEEINDEILADLEAMNQALRIHDVVGRSEQLICDTCKSGLIDYPDIHRRTCRCGGLGYNVTD